MKSWQEISQIVCCSSLEMWSAMDKKLLILALEELGYPTETLQKVEEALHLMEEGFTAEKAVKELELDGIEIVMIHVKAESLSLLDFCDNPEYIEQKLEKHLAVIGPKLSREEFYCFIAVFAVMSLSEIQSHT